MKYEKVFFHTFILGINISNIHLKVDVKLKKFWQNVFCKKKL